MIEAITIIIGLCLASFITYKYSMELDPEHIILKLFLMFITFILIAVTLNIGMIQAQKGYCEVLPENVREAYRYGDNYSQYHWDYASPAPNCPPNNLDCVNLFHVNTTYVSYKEYCFDNDALSGASYWGYRIGLYMFYLFSAYILFYYAYVILISMGVIIPKNKKK